MSGVGVLEVAGMLSLGLFLLHYFSFKKRWCGKCYVCVAKSGHAVVYMYTV